MRDEDEHYDELSQYEEEADDQYDDYEDEEFYDEDDEFDSGMEGYEEDGYDDDDEFEDIEEIEYLPAGDDDYDGYADEDFDQYKANSIGNIDPNDRTLTIVAKNTANEPRLVILFGANENAASPDVEITVAESSHQEVKEESKANPFRIQGFKMSTTEPLQFDEVLRIVNRTATGAKSESVYQPRNATSPQNFTLKIIDDHSFTLNVTGQSSLRFMIKPGVTVVFTFTIKARANMGNLLKGQNVAELSRTPRTTGLPQLDLLQKKKRRRRPQTRTVRRVVRRSKSRPVTSSRPTKRGRKSKFSLRRRRRRR